MKYFFRKGIVIVIVALMILTLPIGTLLTKAEDSKTDPYEVKITSGIEGKYRALKYIPVIVEFTSLEKDFNGEVEIRASAQYSSTYDAYSKEVSALQGETAKVIIPIKVLDGSSKITVNLIENGKVLYEKKSLISNGRVGEANLFMGVLTDDATSLSYTGSISFDNTQGVTGVIEKVQLDKDIIGESNLNIDGLDAIIINNYNMSNLKKEQYEALNSWINKGGTLIIGSGANESKTISSIDKEFLDIKSNGAKEKNIKLVDDSLNLILSSLEIKGGSLKQGTNEDPLIYSVKRGKGEILVSTIDLGLEPLISSKDAGKFLSAILADATGGLFNKNMNGGYMPGYYRSRELTRNIPINEIVGVKSLIVVLAIYALIVGVILYIVLKKLNKRDFTWIAVPLISIIFTLVIYFMGSSTRVKDVVLNQNNIISIDKDGKGTAKGYLGIGTKYKGNIIVKKPEDLTMNYSTEDNYYYGNPEEEEVSNVLRVKTTYVGNNAYFTFNDSAALDMKSFDVVGKEQVLSTIESSFSLLDGKLNGKVKNNLDCDIKKLLLVAGRNIWDMGSLTKGEEREISNLSTTGSSGLQAYSDVLNQKYYDAKWKKDKDLKSEEFKNIIRTSAIIGTVSDEILINKDIKLVAITDLPVEYGVDFGNKSVSKFDTTAIVQNAELDFKDKDGVYNFPDGYFGSTIESSSANVHVDDYNGYLYGQGEVVFKFAVDKNIEVLELTVKQGVDRYGYNGGDNSEKYIYNYKTEAYDKFTMSQGYEKIKDLGNYINNNEVKVKYVVDDMKGQSMIPMITVKGREK
ncbi:hypothetical protein A500_03041 [Clostridium sartagoforme AAU1]|uniref:Uncharacterized protein n=1 Tax=Clostridium sartagoforme AAU1 TaxID=1202534 RepID=R9CEQ6_9CLOT|nr:hypothetical protein [Clostridium sartagoforme]EOR27753.1 hypothetical protein A500_03041 [Clostridium sartagoforme AAU1]